MKKGLGLAASGPAMEGVPSGAASCAIAEVAPKADKSSAGASMRRLRLNFCIGSIPILVSAARDQPLCRRRPLVRQHCRTVVTFGLGPLALQYLKGGADVPKQGAKPGFQHPLLHCNMFSPNLLAISPAIGQ